MTKMVIGLTLVAIVGALLVWFRNFIGPLILTFMLAYLLYPTVRWVSSVLKISWRAAVVIIYLILVILVGGLLTLTGLAVLTQIQNLVLFLQRFITGLPDLVASWSAQTYAIGPLTFNLGELFNLQYFTDQVLAAVQPVLGRIGVLIGSFAGSAFTTLGWGLFVLITSYFLVSESAVFPGHLVRIDIPGYEHDIQRLGNELRIIWNAFLRGQLIIFVMVLISYSILMSILDMGFAFGIAIMAGLARFVPYLGPTVTWILTGLVAFFQVDNYFGLLPWQYTLLVVGLAFLLDQVFDNYISPRVLGQNLNVHPAAILITAVLFANLIGVLGLVLAAPVVATLNTVNRYVMRKMLDLDPWPVSESQPRSTGPTWARSIDSILSSVRKILLKFRR